MRRLLLTVALVGCGSSTTDPPAGSPNDGGSEVCVGAACENPCFSDGWCVEHPGGGGPSDVWASAADDVWVVAQDRSLFRFDGKTWSKSTVPGEGSAQSIFGRAKNDVWVSVADGVEHFDGTKWSPETVTPPSGLVRFGVDAAGEVWASSGASGIYRREGTGWVAKLPDNLVELGVASIAACDGKVWFAAGLMIEWDGTTFWLHGVSENDDQLRGAGAYGSGQAWVSSRWFRRLSGGVFRANLLEGAPRGLSAMSVGSDGKAWAVAEGDVVASYDGSAWKTQATGVKDVLDAAYVSPTVVRIMKKNGAILEWDATTKMQTIIAEVAGATIVGPYALASWLGAGEAYYAEGGSLWHWKEGSLKWSIAGSMDKDVRRIWAESSTSIWGAGGTKLKRSNGTSSTDVATGIALEAGEVYLDVNGSGANDVWVLTSKRNLHFDGATWKAFASGFIGADTVARAVSLGPTDAWIFRGMGRFAHFDGTSFQWLSQSPTIDWIGCAGGGQMVAITQNPAAIFRGTPLFMAKVSDTFPEFRAVDVSFGPTGNAWMLGENAAKNHLAYFDGTKVRTSVDSTGRSYSAIWALPSGEAWAAGSSGILHRKP